MKRTAKTHQRAPKKISYTPTTLQYSACYRNRKPKLSGARIHAYASTLRNSRSLSICQRFQTQTVSGQLDHVGAALNPTAHPHPHIRQEHSTQYSTGDISPSGNQNLCFQKKVTRTQASAFLFFEKNVMFKQMHQAMCQMWATNSLTIIHKTARYTHTHFLQHVNTVEPV